MITKEEFDSIWNRNTKMLDELFATWRWIRDNYKENYPWELSEKLNAQIDKLADERRNAMNEYYKLEENSPTVA